MRTLTYLVAASVDGFIAGPDGDYSMFAGTGDHIQWICHAHPDTLPALALDALGIRADGSGFDTTLMGWNTYAAGFEHTRDPYPHTRQIVFSRTRSPQDADPAIEVSSDDPVEVVRVLKSQPGTGIWLCGGGTLAGQLIDEIDHLVVKVNPVVIGQGIPLFGNADSSARHLRLVGTRQFASGVTVLEYVRGMA